MTIVKCPRCQKRFADIEAVREHLETTHGPTDNDPL